MTAKKPVPLPISELTLRDYFAAAALQGTMAGDIDSVYTSEKSASIAYKHADAMLAERAKL